MSHKFFTVILIFIMLFSDMLTKKAYAYLDPGTGSYVFQVIIAFFVGALYIIKLFWARIACFIKSLFLKKKKKE
ncbi:MAG: hypothetical protein HY810_03780 [Candidatus Omnitrophica bacterium]|nr:hypothetical protein [Candidatus Omnitrophota bacterium]